MGMQAVAASAALLLVLCTAAIGHTIAAGSVAGCDVKLGLKLTHISSIKSEDVFGPGGVEVMDYDPRTKIGAVVEAHYEFEGDISHSNIQFIDFSDPDAPELLPQVAIADNTTTGTPNSVSIWGGYVAVVANGVPATADGKLRIYALPDDGGEAELKAVANLTGCAMPDMVKWLPDGKRILMACEGEPATQEEAGSDPRVSAGPNPEGAIGIVDVATDKNGDFTFTVRRVSIQAYFNAISTFKYAGLIAAGMRIDPRLDGKSQAAMDVEPEYIAFNKNYTRAYATLQENNAIAEVDLTPGKEKVTNIWPLGRKSWGSSSGNVIDVSDKDGAINRRSWNNLESWYQPDTIVFATVGTRELLFIANEGDTKGDATRVKDIGAGRLDPTAFPNGTNLVADAMLGRLNVDPLFGLKNGYNKSEAWNAQGPYDKLIGYGGRSWSIIDAKNGSRLYESGSGIEAKMAEANSTQAQCFNCDRVANKFDDRSDNAGPEPEAIEVFAIESKDPSSGNTTARTYVAVGLERMSGFLLYDVTHPAAPVLGGYYHSRDFNMSLGSDTAKLGDLAPEMVKFVPAADSGNGKALLLLTNEASATVSVWQVESC